MTAVLCVLGENTSRGLLLKVLPRKLSHPLTCAVFLSVLYCTGSPLLRVARGDEKADAPAIPPATTPEQVVENLGKAATKNDWGAFLQCFDKDSRPSFVALGILECNRLAGGDAGKRQSLATLGTQFGFQPAAFAGRQPNAAAAGAIKDLPGCLAAVIDWQKKNRADDRGLDLDVFSKGTLYQIEVKGAKASAKLRTPIKIRGESSQPIYDKDGKQTGVKKEKFVHDSKQTLPMEFVLVDKTWYLDFIGTMNAEMREHGGGPPPQQPPKVEPLPEKKQVEIALDTPDHAMESYTNALNHRDWKGALSVLTPDSQINEVARIVYNAAQGGSGDWWNRTQGLLEKYKLSPHDNSLLQRMRGLPDLPECYDQWMQLVESQPRQLKYYMPPWRTEGVVPLEAEKSAKGPKSSKSDKATVAKFKTENPADERDDTRYYVYVLVKDKAQWHIDLEKSRTETLAFARQSLKPEEALVKSIDVPLEHFYAMAFSPDGKSLVLAYEAGSKLFYRIYRVPDGKMVRETPIEKFYVKTFAFSHSGKILAFGGKSQRDYGDKTEKPAILLTQFPSGKLMRSLTGHSGDVNSLEFAADGKTLYSASRGEKDNTVRAWDVRTGKEESQLDLGADAYCTGFSEGAKFVFAVTNNKSAKVWHMPSGKTKEVDLGMMHSSGVYEAAISHDGKLLGSSMAFWKISTGMPTQSYGADENMSRMAFTPDGTKLVGVDNWTLKIWDVAGLKLLKTLKGHGGHIAGMAISHDGKLAATVAHDKTLKLWRLEEK